MTSRDEVLQKLRRSLPQATDLPDLNRGWTRYPDPAKQFAEVLASVGGTCVPVADERAANEHLRTLESFRAAVKRCTFVPGVGDSTFDPSTVKDPHLLEDADFAVLPAEWAIAENAALWAATDSLIERTLYFISQHLAIVVRRDRLLNTMHEAYDRIDASAKRFGTFLSGPSKTADIEQALVIGAHGARSLTVFLVG